MNKLLVAATFLLFGITGFSQDLNQVDAQGRKQGTWKKYFSNGMLRYEGQFKDDQPYGEFIYYSPYDYVLARTTFISKDISYTLMFHKNGNRRAEGKNIKEQRDSVWIFFDQDGIKVSEESYRMGVKHGDEKVFFDNGELTQIIPWKNGIKEGVWKQYYLGGQLKGQGSFKNNVWSGEVIFYDLDGNVNAKGNYQEGLKEGEWQYFDEEGKVLSKEWYSQGVFVKQEGVNLKKWEE